MSKDSSSSTCELTCVQFARALNSAREGSFTKSNQFNSNKTGCKHHSTQMVPSLYKRIFYLRVPHSSFRYIFFDTESMMQTSSVNKSTKSDSFSHISRQAVSLLRQATYVILFPDTGISKYCSSSMLKSCIFIRSTSYVKAQSSSLLV